jgi:hypothetical protein
MIFQPNDIDSDTYSKFLLNPQIVHENIRTFDNEILDSCLYNSYKKPSYSDIIFLYSHGNSGNICQVIDSDIIDNLSRFGSVFVYDYRGYGMSTGSPSDEGLFIDSKSVWHYLTDIKKVNPIKIILFGHSLGTSITMELALYLVKNNITFSNQIILQNPFSSIKNISREIMPYIGSLVISDLNTNHFIEELDKYTNNLNIYFLHSKEDELIHHNHSHELFSIIKNNSSNIMLVDGSHDRPYYNNNTDQLFNKIINIIYQNN